MMKKILFLLVVLFFAYPVYAQDYAVVVNDYDITDFVLLKQEQGFDVVVISADGEAEEIRQEIQQYPVEYVILVGLDVPKFYVDASGYDFLGTQEDFYTDLYYGVVEGYIPSIYVGRLPVSNQDELDIMVESLREYEQIKWMPDFDKALVFSSDTTLTSCLRLANNAIDILGNRFIVESYIGTGLRTEMLNAATRGASIVAYTGHGSCVNWFDSIWANTVPPNHSSVIAISCKTGCFSQYGMGASWLKNGAVSYIGSAPNTICMRGFFDSYIEYVVNESGTVGEALQAGRDAFIVEYGDWTLSKWVFESYNLFGDPSVKVHVGSDGYKLFVPLVWSN